MLYTSLSAPIAYASSLATAISSSSSYVNTQDTFAASLSDAAHVYYSGSAGFANATLRWGAAQTPQYDMVVKVATEADVQEAVGNPLRLISYAGTDGQVDQIRQCQQQILPCHFGRAWHDDLSQQY